MNRFARVLDESVALSPAGIRDRILEAVRGFMHRQDDDITLLVARRTKP